MSTSLGEALRSVQALDINLTGYCETVGRDRLEIAKHCAQAAVRAINRELREPSIRQAHPLGRRARTSARGWKATAPR